MNEPMTDEREREHDEDIAEGHHAWWRCVPVTTMTEREQAAYRKGKEEGLEELTARLAIVNHITNEGDDCDVDDTKDWCQSCWDDAVAWLAPDATYAVAVQARAAIDALRSESGS